jgi:hypothetical protein
MSEKYKEVKIEKDGIVHILKVDDDGIPIGQTNKTKEVKTPTIQKEIENLGVYIIVYSLFQIIILPLYMIFLTDASIGGSLFTGLFFVPMLTSGFRIKKIGDDDLNKVKNLIIFNIVFSFIIIFISMLGGGASSILLMILLFDLFRVKKKVMGLI